MSKLLSAIQQNQESVLNDWVQRLKTATRRRDLIGSRELEVEAAELLSAIVNVPPSTTLEDFNGAGWEPLKEMLANLSISRASLGFTPSETAVFVVSIKPSLFSLARQSAGGNTDEAFEEISVANEFVDKLALFTTDSYIHGRDQVITRQQEEMLELSTPVVTLWDGIVALPLIGTLDSARTQVVMESLLQAIVSTNSRFAIIDITGVPTVDTLVAQHLLKTITAARLMGAECILSGIRPQIAQTIVHLGINLEDVITKSKLSDAFRLALERSGRKVVRMEKTTESSLTNSRGI
ncbi:RsbR, positive regulator of sigma-B [Acidisarcina polymorpha]|uniref:RsbR, positive regulator of sigma-B n=1 Tax=Acidisarcina polymorpha TaxID=2211140 RepID=A0A2Z5G718_9BACT|nr:STAS domain-containing protein [Acidisarcina polymorpha]AXC14465.1 RsbR, positive regulator of sigma-B [Acidisarcina polymorpha]